MNKGTRPTFLSALSKYSNSPIVIHSIKKGGDCETIHNKICPDLIVLEDVCVKNFFFIVAPLIQECLSKSHLCFFSKHVLSVMPWNWRWIYCHIIIYFKLPRKCFEKFVLSDCLRQGEYIKTETNITLQHKITLQFKI